MGGEPAIYRRTAPRKHPRVRLVTQVESRTSGAMSLGRTDNISVGGMLVLSRETFPAQTEVVIRFSLPSGHRVECTGIVMHTQPGARMGIQFRDLREEDRKAVTDFVHEVKPYTRRSARLAQKLNVTLRWQDLEGNQHEELAETRFLSRYGGLVVSPTTFKPGDELSLLWPEQQQEARIRIVFRQLVGGGLSEVGFEFVDVGNFWEMDFPADAALWE